MRQRTAPPGFGQVGRFSHFLDSRKVQPHPGLMPTELAWLLVSIGLIVGLSLIASWGKDRRP